MTTLSRKLTRSEVAALGGHAVPADKRFFSNPELARAAGRKGGMSVAKEKRTFSTNRTLAVEAGRKGNRQRLLNLQKKKDPTNV